MIVWISFVLRALVSLAVIVVALAVVRRKLPRTSYALAAAAALELFFSCCFRGSSAGMTSVDPQVAEMMGMASACGGGVQTLLVGGLVIAAFALAAREAKPPAS